MFIWTYYMKNEGRQENKKCDVRNYGWEGIYTQSAFTIINSKA